MTTLQQIEKKLVKSSHKRLITYSNKYELYIYEKNFFFNKAPEKKTAHSREAEPVRERREDNLYRARLRIRRLIGANESAWGEKLKFVTYTFGKNVSDLQEANAYWAEYQRKIKHEFTGLKYLAVVEFQKRGAIHYHVLYFNLPFRKHIKKILAETWGHGFVNIQTVEHIRHVGAYVSKYLQKQIMDKRLSREKAFFCSKGLIQPNENRAEETIDGIIRTHILNPEVEQVYQTTHFGKITYQAGIIN